MRTSLAFPVFEPGTVWLAGAGPGDPGLLTLAVANALEQADVILHDDLVGPLVLDMARPGAVLERAGKRAGRPSPRQVEISARLVQLARAGRRVLRLKGGDPFVFGRGAEEALALVRAGIPFRVLPGISAGIGGLAAAGIALTDRATNSSVTFVTGHAASGGGVDWRALAAGTQALVVYMALTNLAEIAAELIAGGRSGAEPAAVVAHATLPQQRVVTATLATIADVASAAAITAPAMLVVGENVRLRGALDWQAALAGAALDPDPLGVARAAG
ncbi:uroporphyrinogen-III C-methyltransferase [Zavarzinia sp. CC-PAN008]|uniref:uroporphyrinogen-III C-methyltransferase n=1 Tax=Zavarzinia sp. CC-PAN008 TaxID=3243332 RepID=UPI003F744D6C